MVADGHGGDHLLAVEEDGEGALVDDVLDDSRPSWSMPVTGRDRRASSGSGAIWNSWLMALI
jgi:hypothetical protein